MKEVNAMLVNAYSLANAFNMPYMIRKNNIITSVIKSSFTLPFLTNKAK